MISWDMDSDEQETRREAKFKIGDDVVDPISGLRGTVVKVEEPRFDWMGFQYEVILSNATRTSFQEDALQECFNTDDVFELCENRNFASYDDYMIVNTLFKIDVTCNLRCSIATSDAPMHHLTLQTDRHNSAISRRISRFQARSPSSRPEKPVFMQSSAMRTQASVLDLQLQMDTLPRGPCHGFAIDALSRTLRPVSRHHVRSGT